MAKVFCFSGTGNSLYAARRIAFEIGADIFNMLSFGEFDDDMIGFVFPAYFWGLPKSVGEFLDNARFINKNAYVFCVVTYGSIVSGVSGIVDKKLKKQGLRLSYSTKVKMVENYLPGFKVNDTDELWKHSDMRLDIIANNIKKRVRSRITPYTAVNVLAQKSYPPNRGNCAANFTVSGCKSCGICEKICPNGNIILENGVPKFDEKCDLCLGCLHACPVDAIDYGKSTHGKKRYKNRRMPANNLIEFNSKENNMFGFGKPKKKDSMPEGGMSEFAKRLVEMLDCPYEHFPKGTDPQKVLNAYDDAFAKREMGGYTPMIVVVSDTLLDILEEDAATTGEFKTNRDKLLSAPEINVQKWFTEQLSYWKNEMGEEDWAETVGEVTVKEGDVSKSFSGFMDFGKTRKSEECILALIPTNEPWEVFAWLPFGGWNDCPPPEDMLWIAKYWYERYNAIPAVIANDILEFSAPPIKDKDTALGLALEQFAFCSDIVFQGVDTIGRLAGGLMQSTSWYFWWD